MTPISLEIQEIATTGNLQACNSAHAVENSLDNYKRVISPEKSLDHADFGRQ